MTAGSKTVQPLEFFKVSAVDFATGRVSVGWELAPNMSVVLETRLEADASQQGSLFGRGKVSTRGCSVRKQVTHQYKPCAAWIPAKGCIHPPAFCSLFRSIMRKACVFLLLRKRKQRRLHFYCSTL